LDPFRDEIFFLYSKFSINFLIHLCTNFIFAYYSNSPFGVFSHRRVVAGAGLAKDNVVPVEDNGAMAELHVDAACRSGY
jgi:hypothetical protein